MPGRAANALLTKLFGSERYLLRKANFPVGVSVLAIAKRKSPPSEGFIAEFRNQRADLPEGLTLDQETHVET
ncbi:MAG: hypothetical protein O9253_00770 [Aquidulcibacter sp.]|jgi:hypothetical protein|nr:hypothetical protein [Aquidulcibacter sp.]